MLGGYLARKLLRSLQPFSKISRVHRRQVFGKSLHLFGRPFRRLSRVVFLVGCQLLLTAPHGLVNRVRLFAGELEGFANELIGTMAREGLV